MDFVLQLIHVKKLTSSVSIIQLWCSSVYFLSYWDGYLVVACIDFFFSFCLQVHEMAMLSAIQEAQKDNLRNFNDYMMKVLEVSVPS